MLDHLPPFRRQSVALALYRMLTSHRFDVCVVRQALDVAGIDGAARRLRDAPPAPLRPLRRHAARLPRRDRRARRSRSSRAAPSSATASSKTSPSRPGSSRAAPPLLALSWPWHDLRCAPPLLLLTLLVATARRAQGLPAAPAVARDAVSDLLLAADTSTAALRIERVRLGLAQHRAARRLGLAPPAPVGAASSPRSRRAASPSRRQRAGLRSGLSPRSRAGPATRGASRSRGASSSFSTAAPLDACPRRRRARRGAHRPAPRPPRPAAGPRPRARHRPGRARRQMSAQRDALTPARAPDWPFRRSASRRAFSNSASSAQQELDAPRRDDLRPGRPRLRGRSPDSVSRSSRREHAAGDERRAPRLGRRPASSPTRPPPHASRQHPTPRERSAPSARRAPARHPRPAPSARATPTTSAAPRTAARRDDDPARPSTTRTLPSAERHAAPPEPNARCRAPRCCSGRQPRAVDAHDGTPHLRDTSRRPSRTRSRSRTSRRAGVVSLVVVRYDARDADVGPARADLRRLRRGQRAAPRRRAHHDRTTASRSRRPPRSRAFSSTATPATAPLVSVYEVEESDCARFLETVFYSECLKLHVDGASAARPRRATRSMRVRLRQAASSKSTTSRTRPRRACCWSTSPLSPRRRDDTDADAAPDDTRARTSCAGDPSDRLAATLAEYLDGVSGRVLLYDRAKNRAALPDRTGHAFDLDGIVDQADASPRRAARHASRGGDGVALAAPAGPADQCSDRRRRGLPARARRPSAPRRARRIRTRRVWRRSSPSCRAGARRRPTRRSLPKRRLHAVVAPSARPPAPPSHRG